MDSQMMQDFQNRIQNDMDVKHREIATANGSIHLFFIDELCDEGIIQHGIVNAFEAQPAFPAEKDPIMKQVLRIPAVGEAKSVDEALSHLLVGDSVLFFDFINEIIYCETKNIVARSVEKSELEPTFKGPQEAFNELLTDNLSLIRKRIADSALKVELFNVGTHSKTAVALIYMEGTAPAEVIEYVRKNITTLSCNYILSHNDIQEKLSIRHTSLDTMGYTEKPDSAVSRLFEGRVVVIVNGCPLVLTAPYFFIENFHSQDDYYSNKLVVNVIRVMRSIAFFIALLLPGFFVALSTFHFSLIPTTFMFKLAVQRSGVPLPTIVEVVVLQFFFELARESGKRLPQQVGQAISIVSALILGEAAVGAGVTSEVTVVVIGVYAVASFLNPKLAGTTYVWSLFIVIMSACLGLYGFYLAFVVFLAHVSSLESCGYPFLFPLGTPRIFNFKHHDFVFRDNNTTIKDKIL